jgi:hypothetical protein
MLFLAKKQEDTVETWLYPATQDFIMLKKQVALGLY